MNDESGDVNEGFSQEPEGPPREPKQVRWWEPKREYHDRSEKRRDFWVGFALWFGLNILLYGLSAIVSSVSLDLLDRLGAVPSSYLLLALPGLGSLLINVILLIYFAFTRRFIALGMLAAFGSVFLLTLLAALLLAGVCFVMMNSAAG